MEAGFLADRHSNASWNDLLQHNMKQQRNVTKVNNSTESNNSAN